MGVQQRRGGAEKRGGGDRKTQKTGMGLVLLFGNTDRLQGSAGSGCGFTSMNNKAVFILLFLSGCVCVCVGGREGGRSGTTTPLLLFQMERGQPPPAPASSGEDERDAIRNQLM